jgi:hypothetical protein
MKYLMYTRNQGNGRQEIKKIRQEKLKEVIDE